MSLNEPENPWLAWRQLLRAGNVFTAASNVIAGFLIVQHGWQPLGLLVTLVAASALLYEAGMVLNDAFDADIDALERPERPIPSRRIERSDALAVGWSLLGGGVVCGALASWLSGNIGPAIVCACLAATIVMYNGGLKATWAGPLAMGWCRLLNVLLGGSVSENMGGEISLILFAVAVGIYTAGLTIYARAENAERPNLLHTWGENLVGAALLVFLPLLVVPMLLRSEAAEPNHWYAWVAAWLLLAGCFGGSLYRARQTATAAGFRRHVATLIMGFIALDALVSWAAAGAIAGALVLTLLVPTVIASRQAPMT